ncbi:MAG: hypothetical protein EA374_01570 [Acholeplasmatales bacterium]|nr:MAG: hypothetical protein EA374_01570 [Acholeplasmatales bacterium]
MYRTLETLPIYGQMLTGHQFIEADVVQVTYENGLSLLLNYRNTPYAHAGNVVPAMGYLIVKEAD